MKTILQVLRMAIVTGALAAVGVSMTHGAEARGRDDGRWHAPVMVYASGDEDDDGRGRGRGRGRGGDDARPYVPLENIIGQIQARTPGRLVGVRGPNGQGIYRIIWETPDGRVITFVVDGRTGQILR